MENAPTTGTLSTSSGRGESVVGVGALPADPAAADHQRLGDPFGCAQGLRLEVLVVDQVDRLVPAGSGCIAAHQSITSSALAIRSKQGSQYLPIASGASRVPH